MDGKPDGGFAALVPELGVFDLQASLRFWCDILGFRVAYSRPESGFAYLQRGAAQVMLEQYNGNWETAPPEAPLGRGINFQITVDDIAPMVAALKAIGWPLFEEPHEAWYRYGGTEGGHRQFLVQDPSGYLLRFAEGIGERSVRS